jgi:hypothetical protein
MSTKFFFQPVPQTCVGVQLPATKTARKLITNSHAIARSNATTVLKQAQEIVQQDSNSRRNQNFVASISHETDGAGAAIFHRRHLNASQKINGAAVDVVLPSRMRTQGRQRWGTSHFSRRWLGVENVRTVAAELKNVVPPRNRHKMCGEEEIFTLSCCVVWGWRESLIKALSPFKFLEREKLTKKSDDNEIPSSAPTFSMQNTKVGKISSSSFVVDPVVGSSVIVIRCEEMVRCASLTSRESEIENSQWSEYLTRKGAMNRIKPEKVSLGAFIFDPGFETGRGEKVVVCFATID